MIDLFTINHQAITIIATLDPATVKPRKTHITASAVNSESYSEDCIFIGNIVQWILKRIPTYPRDDLVRKINNAYRLNGLPISTSHPHLID